MQARFIHDGNALDFLPASDVPAGSVIVQGNLIGITKLDIKSGCLGAVHVVGVYDVAKSEGAIPVGAKIYWDAIQNQASLDPGGFQIGVAVRDAAAEDDTVRVRLQPIEDQNVVLPAETGWRYGEVEIVEDAVPLGVAINPGDIVYYDSGYVKPASSFPVQSSKALSQSGVAAKFLGIAIDAKPQQLDGEEERKIRVATSGVFEIDATANTFVLGSYVGIEEVAARAGIERKKVSMSVSDGSIGKIVRREAVATDSVLVKIKSRILA